MTYATFTKPQAAHALEVVLKLMKERRFFLYNHVSRYEGDDPNYILPAEIFAPAIKLHEKIDAIYSSTRTAAENMILDNEKKLGLKIPEIPQHRRIVQCNRFTGGLDICRVYPLTMFLPYIPTTSESLIEQCLDQVLRHDYQNKLTPETAREKSETIAKKISEQIELMDAQNPDNHRCVVMMQTRFEPGGEDKNNDFMGSKTRDMQEFSFGLGHLFYLYSRQTRIVRHNHVVFDTSRESHINVQHWSNKKMPTINFSAHGGYNCQVLFVTVL